jgi:hypothetical protein
MKSRDVGTPTRGVSDLEPKWMRVSGTERRLLRADWTASGRTAAGTGRVLYSTFDSRLEATGEILLR